MDGVAKQFLSWSTCPTPWRGRLFINSHLSCCGNDAARQDQVDEMMAWIVQNEGNLTVNTPIVYAGDLNLVGYAQQLETLLEGNIVQTQTYGQGGMPDWDGTAWADALPSSHISPSPTRGRTTRRQLPAWTTGLCVVQRRCDRPRTRLRARNRNVARGGGGIWPHARRHPSASDHLPVVMDFSMPPTVTQDSDLDGLDDSEEAQLGTDPFDADTDDDGLTDGFEALVSGTDPSLEDTNDNGCSDGEEAFQLCASCPSDLNNDGIVSVADVLHLLGNFGQDCP